MRGSVHSRPHYQGLLMCDVQPYCNAAAHCANTADEIHVMVVQVATAGGRVSCSETCARPISCQACMHSHETFVLDANATVCNQCECDDVDIVAIDRAIDKYLQDNHENDDTQLALWPEEAVQLLLFSCTKDPSIRIRRAAMSLLTSVVSRQHSAQEACIISTLVLKCRDKDSKVQIQAYQMLLQLPIETLTLHLELADWRAVLDTALLGKQTGNLDCTENQPEIHNLGTDLLHKYLKTTEMLPLQYSNALLSNAGDDVCMQSAAFQTLGHSSQLLQALQLPWHNNTVHAAYCAALSLSHYVH